MSETSEAPAPGPEQAPPSAEWGRLALIVAGTIAIGLWASLPTLLVIVALVFMIFMHELGHYLTAKAAGMKVTEFFIGFGPRLWSFHRGETQYGLKAIPAGAYVRIIGMSNLETDIPPEDEERTYRQKSYWRRMSVALAGSAMHFLMAVVLIFAVFSGFGTPDTDSSAWTVAQIVVDSPADEAGLQLGDRIVEVDGRPVDGFGAASRYFRARPGETVELTVARDSERLQLTATLAEQNNRGEAVGFLGVGPEYPRDRMNPVTGAREAVATTVETMWLSVRGLGQFFSPSGLSGYLDTLTEGADERTGPAQVTEEDPRLLSPVGAVRIAGQAAESGLVELITFLFLINVFVGVFNLVPLLPLDGGHVAIATYEKLRSVLQGGRRYYADVAKLLPLTYAVVMVLVLVGVTALYLDLADPLANPFE